MSNDANHMPPGSDHSGRYGAEGPSGSEAPVCPRHPDRVSYVRCQRCGRPVCPQCQVSADVGVRCVDCEKQARSNMPTQHRPARWTDKYGSPIPVVTVTLIALCVVVYIIQWATSAQTDGGLTSAWSYAGVFTSAAALDSQVTAVVPWLDFEPWRMLTSAFLHSTGNVIHIVFNMLALWMMGRILEPHLGWVRFLALYLVSALGGSVAVLLLADPLSSVVGASGAVYGLFAALFIVTKRHGGQTVSIAALIGVNLVISFMGSNISWQGHIGGLVVGAAVAAVFVMLPARPKDSAAGAQRSAVPQWLAVAGVVVVLGILTWVGGSQITIETLLHSQG